MTTETAPTHSDTRRGSATTPAARDPESQDSKQGTAGHAGKTVGLLLACTNLVIVLAVLCTTAFYFVMRGNDVEKFAPLTQVQRASWNMIETFKPNLQLYFDTRVIYERELFLTLGPQSIKMLKERSQMLRQSLKLLSTTILLSNEKMYEVGSSHKYYELPNKIVSVKGAFRRFTDLVPRLDIEPLILQFHALIDKFVEEYFDNSQTALEDRTSLSDPSREVQESYFRAKDNLDKVWIGAIKLTAQLIDFLDKNLPFFVEQVRARGMVPLEEIGTEDDFIMFIYSRLLDLYAAMQSLCVHLQTVAQALHDADLKKQIDS